MEDIGQQQHHATLQSSGRISAWLPAILFFLLVGLALFLFSQVRMLGENQLVGEDVAVMESPTADSSNSSPANGGAPATPNETATVIALVLRTAVAAKALSTPAVSTTPLPAPTDTPMPIPTDTPMPIPTDTPVPIPTDTPVPPPPLPVQPEMVTIPAGSFTMGSSTEDRSKAVAECNMTEGNCKEEYFDDEEWSSPTTLGTYSIGKYEVTNAEYNACVRAGFCSPPGLAATDGSIAYDSGFFADDRPVVGVTWYDANAFCSWIGGRLPAEEEWEKAARGPGDQRRYPWGDAYEAGRANLGTGYPTAVGSFPTGASPYGIMDLTGNVYEWTTTNDDRGYVLRGGGWNKPFFRGRVSDRGTQLPRDFRNFDIGFRCVR
jgi:formylglycine-generating enzyme required for sulfatase activity